MIELFSYSVCIIDRNYISVKWTVNAKKRSEAFFSQGAQIFLISGKSNVVPTHYFSAFLVAIKLDKRPL